MKQWRTILIVTLLLALTAFVGVSSVGATASGFNSGIQVQNLDSANSATITLTAYKKDGSVAATASNQTIAAGSSVTYFPLGADNLNVGDSFDGSVVISADKPVAAISNVLAKDGNGNTVAASYGGFSAGASTVSAPLIFRNNSGFNTTFNVQNTGSADASVTVTYVPGSSGNSGCTETATIKPGAAATFDQSGNTCLGDKFVGSANIDAGTGTVAATVLEIGNDTLFAYNAFTSGSTDIAMPLINTNNSGFVTGVQIQNVGTASTDVTVSYTPSSAGTACTEKQTIAAGASATFAFNSFASTIADENCADGVTFVGSARISANSASQPLVAVVNQLSTAATSGAAYNAFDPTAGTSSVSLPLMMDNNSGFFTGYSILNVGSSAVDLTCTYSTVGGHTPTAGTSTGLAAGAAYTVNDNGKLRADANTAYVGSATCTAPGGSLVGIVNELSTGTGDLFLVYEGFGTN